MDPKRVKIMAHNVPTVTNKLNLNTLQVSRYIFHLIINMLFYTYRQ